MNVTADGADRFAVTISSITSVNTHLYMGISDTFGSMELMSSWISVPSAGVYYIPLSVFTVPDLTSVEWLRLTVTNVGTPAPTSVAVSNFATVPEPSTVLLLATGLAALALRGRAQR